MDQPAEESRLPDLRVKGRGTDEVLMALRWNLKLQVYQCSSVLSGEKLRNLLPARVAATIREKKSRHLKSDFDFWPNEEMTLLVLDIVSYSEAQRAKHA